MLLGMVFVGGLFQKQAQEMSQKPALVRGISSNAVGITFSTTGNRGIFK
jgi:hypothetical protein